MAKIDPHRVGVHTQHHDYQISPKGKFGDRNVVMTQGPKRLKSSRKPTIVKNLKARIVDLLPGKDGKVRRMNRTQQEFSRQVANFLGRAGDAKHRSPEKLLQNLQAIRSAGDKMEAKLNGYDHKSQLTARVNTHLRNLEPEELYALNEQLQQLSIDAIATAQEAKYDKELESVGMTGGLGSVQRALVHDELQALKDDLKTIKNAVKARCQTVAQSRSCVANLMSGNTSTVGDSDIHQIAAIIHKYHQDPAGMQREVEALFDPGKVRDLLSGRLTPDSIDSKVQRRLEWILTSQHQGYSDDEKAWIKQHVTQLIRDMMPRVYDSAGVKPLGDRFEITQSGVTRMTPHQKFLGLGTADLQTLLGLYNNPQGLQQHIGNDPNLALRLLATPRGDLTVLARYAPNTPPNFDVNQFMSQLATAAGFQLDQQGFTASSQTLANLLRGVQGQPGVAPDFAYRLEVQLQKTTSTCRLGGQDLMLAANALYGKDISSTQKVPPHLECLTRTEMTQIATAINNPTALEQLFSGDEDLQMKVITTHPDDLKAHLALQDLGGTSVDVAYRNLLSVLPGHDAVVGPNRVPQSVTITGEDGGSVQYDLEKDSFGGPAGYGQIMLMQSSSNPESKIILKKFKSQDLDSSRVEEYAHRWEMMANEMKIHSWLSSGSDNVVKFLAPLRIGDEMYMAMEFCPGGNLTDLVTNGKIDQVATAKELDPRVTTALKLSVMQDMLNPMTYIETDHQVVDHDVKSGNFYLRGDGTVVLADFGAASVGTTSSNHPLVDNPIQKSPEICGNPGGGVDVKSDLFALGIQMSTFLFGKNEYATLQWQSDQLELLKILHEHRDGFVMPPAPKVTDLNYPVLKEAYDRATAQQQLIKQAGFQIDPGTGKISLFPLNTTNPLERLVNDMTAPNPTGRSTPTSAFNAQPFQAISDPQLKSDLRKLTALMNKAELTRDTAGNVSDITFKDPQDQTEFDRLSSSISQSVAHDVGHDPLWQSMKV